MAEETDAGAADSATDVAVVCSVSVSAGEVALFPAGTLLLHCVLQAFLSSLQVLIQSTSPSGAVRCGVFPGVRFHFKGFHVPLADIPVAQLWTSSGSFSGCKFSI